MQRVCEDDGEAVPTTVFDSIELARDAIEAKRKNATLSN